MKRTNKVKISCQECGIEILVTKQKSLKKKYCSRNCQAKHYRESGMFSGEKNPSYGKVYRTKITHPEWAKKIRSNTKGINSGNKNGMKNPEVAKRMSKTRREKVTSSLEYRKNLSKKMIAAWKAGKYENVNVGRCKWYTLLKKNGSTCKVQGKWELAYAKYLDDNDIEFLAHRGRISYVDDFGNSRSYYPDFFLVKNKVYVEIKADYWLKLQENKFSLIKNQNVNISIEILTKKELKELGVM